MNWESKYWTAGVAQDREPPFYSSGNAGDVRLRIETARQAAIQSFFNRFGRMPTNNELTKSLPSFLAPELRPFLARDPIGMESPSPTGSPLKDRGGGPGTGDWQHSNPLDRSSTPDGQNTGEDDAMPGSVGVAAASDVPVYRILEPASQAELHLPFGKGQVRGWLRVTNADNSIWSWMNRSPTRPGPLKRSNQVDISFQVELQTATQIRPRVLVFSVVNDLPPGRDTLVMLDGGVVLEGPGSIYIAATNRAAFTTQVALGVDRL